MTADERRYARDLAATLTTAATLGFLAGAHLPNPIAVMTIIGALTAAATAPIITPAPRPEEDTRP